MQLGTRVESRVRVRWRILLGDAGDNVASRSSGLSYNLPKERGRELAAYYELGGEQSDPTPEVDSAFPGSKQV